MLTKKTNPARKATKLAGRAYGLFQTVIDDLETANTYIDDHVAEQEQVIKQAEADITAADEAIDTAFDAKYQNEQAVVRLRELIGG